MKNYKFSVVFGFLAGITLLFSYSSNPPNGRTGPPCDINLCTNCHSGGGGLDGSLAIAGIPDTVYSNTTYDLTISLNNPNLLAQRAGFQLTVMNSSNIGIGEFDTADPNATIQPGGSRQYLEHNPAKNFPGIDDNIVSYTASWKAPDGPIGEVLTFCSAGNIANGNGNNSGDRIVQMSFEAILQAAPLQASFASVSEVSCFGFADGSATVQATGGMLDYQFKWDNGEMTVTALALDAGMHQVTITDGLLDSLSLSIIIDQPDSLQISIIEITPPTSESTMDGAIQIEVIGGTPPYIFEWHFGDDVISESEDLQNISIGDYIVYVLDANNCSYNSAPIIVVDITSTTQDQYWDNLLIYPNPFNNAFFIEFGDNMKSAYQVRLFNSSQQLILSKMVDSSSSIRLPENELSSGIYYLQITSENKQSLTRLVKI